MSVRVTINEQILKILCEGQEAHVDGWDTQIQKDVEVTMILQDIGIDRIEKITGADRTVLLCVRRWLDKDAQLYETFRRRCNRHVNMMVCLFAAWIIFGFYFLLNTR